MHKLTIDDSDQRLAADVTSRLVPVLLTRWPAKPHSTGESNMLEVTAEADPLKFDCRMKQAAAALQARFRWILPVPSTGSPFGTEQIICAARGQAIPHQHDINNRQSAPFATCAVTFGDGSYGGLSEPDSWSPK